MSETLEPRPCLNCGAVISTKYCPECGQHNTSHNHGLWQFIQEFLEEFFRFDSKLVRTLTPLLRKPGFLTQEWTAGKRVSYISPLKLYITLSALCFLAIGIKSHYISPKENDFKVHLTSSNKPTPVRAKGDTAVDDLLKRKLGRPQDIDPKVISEKFMNRVPTMNFVLMPVVACVFWLLYVRRKRYYVEHLVFTLHFYSFVFLVVGVAALIPLRLVTGIAFLWCMLYLPFAMKRNYGQSWPKTLAKWFLFSGLYLVIIAFGTFATLIVSAFDMPDLPAGNAPPPTVNAPSR